MLRLFSIVLLLVTSTVAMAAEPMTEKQKIDALLNSLDTPDITFVRNGKDHDGAWAKKHLTEKLAKATPAITTADDFIAKVGTTSAKTGKPYMIKTKDGKTTDSATWFQAKLAELNQPSAGSTDSTPKQ
jgi:hypothetical protein